jgi:hypothetical protein
VSDSSLRVVRKGCSPVLRPVLLGGLLGSDVGRVGGVAATHYTTLAQ